MSITLSNAGFSEVVTVEPLYNTRQAVANEEKC